MLTYYSSDIGTIGSLSEALKEAKFMVQTLENPKHLQEFMAQIPEIVAGLCETPPANSSTLCCALSSDGRLVISVTRFWEDEP